MVIKLTNFFESNTIEVENTIHGEVYTLLCDVQSSFKHVYLRIKAPNIEGQNRFPFLRIDDPNDLSIYEFLSGSKFIPVNRDLELRLVGKV